MCNKILLFLGIIFFYNCSPEITKEPEVAMESFDSQVFEVGTKNAIIVWDEAQNLNLGSTHYSIVLNDKEIVSDLEGITYTFKNLSPRTMYEGRILAEDQKGNQSIANFTFKTSGAETINQASL